MSLRPAHKRTSNTFGRTRSAAGRLNQAEIYTREIWRHIEAIAAQPTIGRLCPEVRDGYYKYPTGSHVLFYRLDNERGNVVRILHGRMDFERHIPP